eukprot:04719.XXX_119973_120164_1 [CDS] Oithona nana genome sequencing.
MVPTFRLAKCSRPEINLLLLNGSFISSSSSSSESCDIIIVQCPYLRTSWSQCSKRLSLWYSQP